MLPKRVIPCLDVDGGRVVKGTGFMDMYDVGDPVQLARHYEAEGADELIFLDITATAERRSTMVDIARQTAAGVFIPFTIGGGIRSEADAQALLDAGADKVAVNSAALSEPKLLNKLSGRFGKQCTVLSMDVKGDGDGGWEVYAAGGKVATGWQAIGWAQEAVRRGAGEIVLTSIDRDGTNSGYNLDLIKALTRTINIPVVASGGAGRLEHYDQAIGEAGAEAVLAASQLHSGEVTVSEVKSHLMDAGISVRPIESPAEQLLPFAPGSARPQIALVDYGAGNRYSVEKALERVGASVTVTDDADELVVADGIVLPGVGAFQPAMRQLDETGLSGVLRRLTALGKPVLGICLGEQLLFYGSQEQGWWPGLGLLPGIVQEIELPIRPNIGWREVSVEQSNGLTEGLSETTYFYHLHEYAATVSNDDVAAYTHLPYGEDPAYRVASMVRRHNMYGVQFHPEKSSTAGLRLLRNFVEISANVTTEL